MRIINTHQLKKVPVPSLPLNSLVLKIYYNYAQSEALADTAAEYGGEREHLTQVRIKGQDVFRTLHGAELRQLRLDVIKRNMFEN